MLAGSFSSTYVDELLTVPFLCCLLRSVRPRLKGRLILPSFLLLLCGFEIRQLEETEDFNAFVALAGKQ